MNAPVDVMERHPDADARLGIIDCDIHPYMKPGALEPVPVRALAQARGGVRQVQLRHLCRSRHLSALLAEHVAARFLAARRRTAGLRRRVHARAVAGRLQHQLRRAGAAAGRQHLAQPGRGGGALLGDERLAGARLRRSGAAAARVDPGAAGRSRGVGEGDREARRRLAVRADPVGLEDVGAARARAATGRSSPPRRRTTCRSACISAARRTARRPPAAGRNSTSRTTTCWCTRCRTRRRA